MPNPATSLSQDERIPGLPALPPNTDPATLSVPVYNPATDLTHQSPIGGPAAASNTIVGGPKLVQYRDSRLYGVPAKALTLDRLKPWAIVPGTLATVDNPADTPLSTTLPPARYVATVVAASTTGAVLVPRYIGAADTDTVPIIWRQVVDGGQLNQYHTLGFMQDYLANGPDLIPALRYDLTGNWNASGESDQVVYVQAATATTFEAYGTLESGAYPNRLRALVQVDVVAGTAVPLKVDLSAYAKKQDLADLIGAAPAALDTLAEIAAQLQQDEAGAAAMLATLQQHTQQISQNSGWIGNLSALTTTAKASLVAAVNELAARVVAKYYATTGQATDGAMTQKATTNALAGKLDIANAWPDLSNEVQIYANLPTNKITPGAANVFSGDVSRDLPEGNDPFTQVSGLMYWRALADTNLTFTKGTLDGATSLTLAAGDWLFLLGLGGRNSADRTWYVRMRGKVNGAGGGTGTVKTVNGVAPDASGDVALATTDRYDVAQAVRDAVLAGTFGSGELQGTQPAGSLAGQRFTTATYGYEYERGAGGALVWCRYAKS